MRTAIKELRAKLEEKDVKFISRGKTKVFKAKIKEARE